MRSLKIRNKPTKANSKLFTRKKSIVFFVFLIACLVVIMTSLVVLDNLTVVLKRETVAVNGLPSQISGYSVLHLTDLHGQMFGSEHSTLLRAVQGRAYDAVLITGDLVDKPHSIQEQENTLLLVRKFAELKKPVYYVLGNHDPSFPDPFYDELSQAGAVVVDAPVRAALKDGNAVWLFPFSMYGITTGQARAQLDSAADGSDSADRLRRLVSALDAIGENDLIIAMTHYPLTPERVKDFAQRMPEGEEMLRRLGIVLSGHYHGGQMRLPIIGAVYVPADTLGINGFFPDNKHVRGLTALQDLVTQNISGGIGSTGFGSTDLFKFRLFSTPEVSLITFVSE